MFSSIDCPDLRCLSRREALLVLASAAVSPVLSAALPGTAREDAPSRRVLLPENPCHGPGFSIHPLPEDRLLAFTRTREGSIKAYILNPAGRRIRALCNGKRATGEIARITRAQTGLPEDDTLAFLQVLRSAGIISFGGFVETRNGFPRAPDGAGYHLLSAETPES